MYLGNNFWLKDDLILNTKTGHLIPIDEAPAMIKFNRSCGNFQLCLERSEFPSKDGTKFVVIDYCESFFYSKTGKTKYAKFINFEYICDGWNGHNNVNWNFEKDNAYIMFFQVDASYPFNLKLIKKEKLRKNGNTIKEG